MVGADGSAPGGRRGAAGDVLGHRRGAPAAVRRLAGRPWLGLGQAGWAGHHDVPSDGPLDLFGMDDGDGSDPVAPDGHLRAEWVGGGWSDNLERMARWAGLARAVAGQQQAALAGLDGLPMAVATARCESTAELLCAELSAYGLPMDRAVAEQILTAFIGPRPRSEADAAALRAARDAEVLRQAPAGVTADLRSPAQVRSLLARVGVDVPDTRAWRLREMRDAHPLVGALLEWRKAERIATTYGYAWLDAHLGADGRLRGEWTGSDGAAGRMTALAGLHNMPAALRRQSWPPTGTCSSGPTWARSSRGCWPRYPGIRHCWRRPGPTICTHRWRRSSAWAGRSPRSRSSARCTGRPPATAPRRCAACPRLIRWRWPTSTPPTGPGGPAVTCAPTAGADRAGTCSRPGCQEQQPGGGLRPVRAQCDDPGRRG